MSNTFLKLYFILSISLFISSCTNFSPISDLNFKVQTFDLFSQLPSPEFKETQSNIYSNWTFRRERLSLIDFELAKSKPNIIFFQHLMKKSITNSDEVILASNSLARYRFTNEKISNSSNWKEYISIVTGAKFNFISSKLYSLGSDSFILAELLSYKQDPILLINVQLKKFNEQKFFNTLEEIYKDTSFQKVCKHRIILGGYFGDNLADNFSELIEDKYFKNPFSYLKKQSISTFKDNPLYNMIIKEPKDPLYNYDYLFVPSSATVSDAHLVYTNSYPNKLKRIGIKQIAPSLRAGLELSVRMRSCL